MVSSTGLSCAAYVSAESFGDLYDRLCSPAREAINQPDFSLSSAILNASKDIDIGGRWYTYK